MKNDQIPQNVPALLKDQQGSTALIIALMLPIFLGFAALAVDVGYMMMVKAQLNNAAEAGALSGARSLVPYTGTPARPDWANGTLKARQAVELNYYANNQPLTVSEAVAGAEVPSLSEAPPRSQATPCYWSLTNNIPQPTTITTTDNDIAAMQVTVAKTVAWIFPQIWGSDTKDLVGKAVAILPSPSTINPGGMFPFAIPKDYVRQHWSDNPTTSFTIGGITHNSSGGAWTTFQNGQVGAATVSGLVTGGNSIPISLDNQIYIQSGEQGSVFNTVSTQLSLNPNKVYMIPVVDRNPIPTGTQVTVDSFVPFMITGCSGSGEDPHVTGHFVPGYISPQAAGVSGIYNGDPSPPKVVN